MTFTHFSFHGVSGTETTLADGTPVQVFPDPEGGPTVARDEKDSWFHLDPTEQERLYEQDYHSVQWFREDRAVVEAHHNDFAYHIRLDGSKAYPAIYTWVHPFKNGRAKVGWGTGIGANPPQWIDYNGVVVDEAAA